MKRLLFAISAALLLSLVGCTSGMDFKIAPDGTLTMKCNGKEFISRSSVGLVLKDGELHSPVAAKVSKGQITLSFDGCEVVLDASYRDNGSLRMSVASIPDEIDGFVFGPFVCPDCNEAGEYIGAAWREDGSLVCIQSLNPKTEGECDLEYINNTDFHSPGNEVATLEDGTVYLSCSAGNMTRPRLWKTEPWSGFKNVLTEVVPAPEGSIEGAAIVLTCAPDGDSLLEDIHKLEIEEGLPSPTVDGEWAKTSKYASELYFVFGPSGVRGLNFPEWTSEIKEQVKMAERAGVHWVYFNDPFETWGHFGINRQQYPGGFDEFKDAIGYAKEHGVNIGFHTLSNFIHSDDPFVSPVPDKGMLAHDRTPIIKDISDRDTEIFIGEPMNYTRKSTFNAVWIGDELIRYTDFNSDRMCLTGCQRGAFGTTPSSHKAGDEISRLPDDGYQTFFPTYALQGEMADNIAGLIKEAGIRRMSFDGMEGCRWTGLGEFACSSYVKRVFDTVGSELICDASTPSHYRWHAHSYFNWGEACWDSNFRGGMHNYRAQNQIKFDRNLMHNMFGWFIVRDGEKHLEPSLPEDVEFILSRMVAFDAGICMYFQTPYSEKLDSFMDIVRDWQDFRATVDVPEDVRAKMRAEKSDWHLEKKDGKWILTDMFVYPEDLSIRDRVTKVGPGAYSHRSTFMTDTNSPSKDVPFLAEPLHFRLRVGDCYDHGKLEGLSFCGLKFDVKADAGDYLEYDGGTTLYHYDKDYYLLETVPTEGKEVIWSNTRIRAISYGYTLTGLKDGEEMVMSIKQFRPTQQFVFDVK